MSTEVTEQILKLFESKVKPRLAEPHKRVRRAEAKVEQLQTELAEARAKAAAATQKIEELKASAHESALAGKSVTGISAEIQGQELVAGSFGKHAGHMEAEILALEKQLRDNHLSLQFDFDQAMQEVRLEVKKAFYDAFCHYIDYRLQWEECCRQLASQTGLEMRAEITDLIANEDKRPPDLKLPDISNGITPVVRDWLRRYKAGFIHIV